MLTKSVYITPYTDTGLGKPVIFWVVWLLWVLHLALKILCKDGEWTLFLFVTYLLLLFSVQFFIVSRPYIYDLVTYPLLFRPRMCWWTQRRRSRRNLLPLKVLLRAR